MKLGLLGYNLAFKILFSSNYFLLIYTKKEREGIDYIYQRVDKKRMVGCMKVVNTCQ